MHSSIFNFEFFIFISQSCAILCFHFRRAPRFWIKVKPQLYVWKISNRHAHWLKFHSMWRTCDPTTCTVLYCDFCIELCQTVFASFWVVWFKDSHSFWLWFHCSQWSLYSIFSILFICFHTDWIKTGDVPTDRANFANWLVLSSSKWEFFL